MKKSVFVLALLLSVCLMLSACNFTTNMSNNTPFAKMSHQTEVETILAHLSEGQMEKAVEMMHKDKTDTAGLDQISKYLDGRKVNKLETQSVNMRTVKGNRGSEKTETASFQATLDDGETVYLSVVFYENQKDQGFMSFQLVLGAI